VRPFFCHFTLNLQKILPRIFSAADIFLGPLLRFAAEISAGWQHWIFYRLDNRQQKLHHKYQITQAGIIKDSLEDLLLRNLRNFQFDYR
jgi:hypothetical protein